LHNAAAHERLQSKSDLVQSWHHLFTIIIIIELHFDIEAGVCGENGI
jgi:hypothetical protein